MLYGKELIESLRKDIDLMRKAIDDRWDRINEGITDIDDCFISQRCEERGIETAKAKIQLIEDGGYAWFREYATLDGQIVNAHWCNTKYGYKLRVEMPDGSVVWTTASTKNGLARKGIRQVECKRPAWFKFSSGHGGMLGVYTGDYVLFPSDRNYATGKIAEREPIEIRDVE
jgi:hypothetical protein